MKTIMDECIGRMVQDMTEVEAMIPIAVEAAIEAGIALRGAEAIYTWFSEIADSLALRAAKERNERDKRSADIMQKFG